MVRSFSNYTIVHLLKKYTCCNHAGDILRGILIKVANEILLKKTLSLKDQLRVIVTSYEDYGDDVNNIKISYTISLHLIQ